MSEIVVLDACVLVPYNLSSLLLTLAEADLFQARWSERILDETERTLVHKLKKPPDKVGRRLGAMRDAFPEASVSGFEWLEERLTCHPKDRHVLAAAIASGATTIVTLDLDDFPDGACTPFDVVARHPDEFLMSIFGEHPEATAAAVAREATRTRRPSLTPGGMLARIADMAPTFANSLHQMMLDGVGPVSSVPAYVTVPVESTPLHALRESPDPKDALHVAFAWWAALLNRDRYLGTLHDLTHSADAFGDYAWALNLLKHRSIASRVYYAVDDPERVAFIRFVPEVAETSQVFESFATSGAVFMTLCRYPDDTWRVWGLGPVMVGARAVALNTR